MDKQEQLEAANQSDRLSNLIRGLWQHLSEAQQRMVYVRAGRRVVHLAIRVFPSVSFASQALDLAELALLGCVNGSDLSQRRVELFRHYQEFAPGVREGIEERTEEEQVQWKLAIRVNEMCMRAASWNLTLSGVDWMIGWYLGKYAGELEMKQAVLSDMELLSNRKAEQPSPKEQFVSAMANAAKTQNRMATPGDWA